MAESKNPGWVEISYAAHSASSRGIQLSERAGRVTMDDDCVAWIQSLHWIMALPWTHTRWVRSKIVSTSTTAWTFCKSVNIFNASKEHLHCEVVVISFAIIWLIVGFPCSDYPWFDGIFHERVTISSLRLSK